MNILFVTAYPPVLHRHGGGVRMYHNIRLLSEKHSVHVLSFVWTAEEADLLIHDSQYAPHQYPARIGWGHSSMRHVLDFATLTDVKHLVPFHHDPEHTDDDLDRLMAEVVDEANPAYRVTPGREGATFKL